MQKILTLQTKKYEIKIDNFEGPLDLLCYLIDKNKMDIYDIKISEITDQYIEYLNQMEVLNLEIASEFLVMASTVVYIKSKSLLPKQPEEEEELSEEELIQRIIDYKRYKEVSKLLKQNFQIFSKRFYKLQEDIELPKQELQKEYSKEVIPEYYEKLINRNKEKLNKNAENIEKIAITDTYTVASKVKQMLREIVKNSKFVFSNVFPKEKCKKVEIVTAFTGLLELTRRSKVTATQEDLFGDIIVEKAKKG